MSKGPLFSSATFRSPGEWEVPDEVVEALAPLMGSDWLETTVDGSVTMYSTGAQRDGAVIQWTGWTLVPLADVVALTGEDVPLV